MIDPAPLSDSAPLSHVPVKSMAKGSSALFEKCVRDAEVRPSNYHSAKSLSLVRLMERS